MQNTVEDCLVHTQGYPDHKQVIGMQKRSRGMLMPRCLGTHRVVEHMLLMGALDLGA